MDLQLDKNTHDLTINTDLQMISGIDETLQRIKISLLFIYGEWYLDTTLGVDWFGTAFIKAPNPNFIDNMILTTIADDPDITNIIEFKTTISKTQRKLFVSFKANTIYGKVISFNEGFTI